MERVLLLWREAERDLETHPEDDTERQGISADIERLRWLYQSILCDVRDERARYDGADRTIVEAMTLRRVARGEAARLAANLAAAATAAAESAAAALDLQPDRPADLGVLVATT